MRTSGSKGGSRLKSHANLPGCSGYLSTGGWDNLPNGSRWACSCRVDDDWEGDTVLETALLLDSPLPKNGSHALDWKFTS